MTYLLGEDGKVHTGYVQEKMSGWAMETDCHVPPLRPIGPNEKWWEREPRRFCSTCGTDPGAG